MAHPKTVGDRSTLAVMLALQTAGYAVLVPFGENTRYDLVIDDGRRLSRVQCKSARLRSGAIEFAVSSCYAHHPHPKVIRRSYAGEVDFFGVYCRETRDVLLVPIEELPMRVIARLRVTPPLNNQRVGIRYAEAYRLAVVSVDVS
jgi:hypothetical protein